MERGEGGAILDWRLPAAAAFVRKPTSRDRVGIVFGPMYGGSDRRKKESPSRITATAPVLLDTAE